MTTLDSPQLQPQAPTASSTGLTGWLQDNKWWLIASLILAAIALVLYLILSSTSRTKRLQRDALEKLRKSLVQSARATRGPAKTIWLTGSVRDPPIKIGRYLGHHHGLEAVWLAYRTWLLGKTRLLCASPVDVNGLDAIEINVRGIGINITRDIAFNMPDTHNADQRADWQRVTTRELSTGEAFTEAAKAYYARAVDNALAFYDSLNAAEDRSFLRQEVTRSQDELTETLTVPTQRPANTDDASTE